jgi:hypothetical protein
VKKQIPSNNNLWLVEASSADEIRSLFSGHSFNNLLVIQCGSDYSATMDSDHIDCCSFIQKDSPFNGNISCYSLGGL